MADSRLLNAHQAAAYLQLTPHTVRRLARSNEIPCFKVGGVWRFGKDQLDDWFDAKRLAGHGTTVLVVDDEEYMLYVMRRALEEEGFSVTTASSGAEALDSMGRSLPDLVLLDLKMPGMNGPEVIGEIRHRWGDLPVVILTGYPEGELVNQALQYSPITLLTKDALPAVVARTVKRQLGQYSSRS